MAAGPKTTHDELQISLARHFRESRRPNIWAWSEIGLSGSWSSDGRVDVVTVTWLPNHRGVRFHGYEVKCTRSDFQRDIDNLKYRQYLKGVDYLSFAVPAGLVTKDEVPDECGIFTFGKNGWRTTRKAPPNDAKVDRADVLARLLRRAGPASANSHSNQSRLDRLRAYSEMQDLAYLVTGRMGERLRSILALEGQYESQMARLKEQERRLDDMRESLGLAPDLLKALARLLQRAGNQFPQGGYGFGRGAIRQDTIDEIDSALEAGKRE